jgi:predicted metal-dependent phosphoesterase TrpH
MFLADFHTHTRASDGKLSLRELVDLFGSRGFGAIAVTDHLSETCTLAGRATNLLGRSVRASAFARHVRELELEADRAWSRYRMLVLAGSEITAAGGEHVLALGVAEFIPGGLEVSKLCESIRSRGGLAIAAHPLRTPALWNRREELRGIFDAWETATGAVLHEEVKNTGLPLIAGSTLHRAEHIRSWKTVLKCERTASAVLDAIRRQHVSFTLYADTQFIPPPARAPLLRYAALQQA